MTIGVTSIEPGWVTVHFKSPPLHAERRLSSLNRALEDWLKDHPSYKLESIQPVEDGGLLRGLNAFYRQSPTIPERGKLHVQIEPALQNQYGLEYMEAVVAEAMSFMLRNQPASSAFAVVNRRQVAIVINCRKSSAFITTLEEAEAALSPQRQAALRDWLENLETQIFACEMPDSFLPHWAAAPKRREESDNA